jgi:hypothetical protein
MALVINDRVKDNLVPQSGTGAFTLGPEHKLVLILLL